MTEPEWKFEAAITSPAGVRVVATVTVPQDQVWKDVGEVAELAQMCASQAATRLTKMVRDSANRIPF